MGLPIVGRRRGTLEDAWIFPDAVSGTVEDTLVFLPVDPKWDAYKSDPRFRALIERCGFAEGER